MNDNQHLDQAYQTDAYDDDYESVPLYNPNAAALWSILFTPFGAWIHAKNWEAVDEYELAKQNYIFAIVIIVVIILLTIIEMLTGISIPIPHIALLVVWYYRFGKKQIELVKEQLGNDYEKRSLVVPVLVGVVGGAAGLFAVITILQLLFDAIGILHPSWFND